MKLLIAIFLLCCSPALSGAVDARPPQPIQAVLGSDIVNSLMMRNNDSIKVYTWSVAELSSDAGSVQAINASSLHWISLPDELGKYKNLIYLDLSDNAISLSDSDVKCLQELKNLKYLLLEKNHLDDSGWKRLSSLSLQGLVFLNVSSNQISHITLDGSVFRSLKSLLVINNRLDSLPESVGELVNLQELDLSFNHLLGLPSAIAHLNALTNLRLMSNHIKSIEILPPNLVNFSAFSNLLEAFPEPLARCKALKYLELSGNPIKNIPDWLANFPALESLLLRDTEIKSIPPFLAKMPHLHTVYLPQSASTALPEELKDLVSRRVIEFYQNGPASQQ